MKFMFDNDTFGENLGLCKTIKKTRVLFGSLCRTEALNVDQVTTKSTAPTESNQPLYEINDTPKNYQAICSILGNLLTLHHKYICQHQYPLDLKYSEVFMDKNAISTLPPASQEQASNDAPATPYYAAMYKPTPFWLTKRSPEDLIKAFNQRSAAIYKYLTVFENITADASHKPKAS